MTPNKEEALAALSVLDQRVDGYQSAKEILRAFINSQDGWRPIETAPENVSILGFIPNAEHYGQGVYRCIKVNMGTGIRWSVSGLHMGRDTGLEYQPTHWRPLPPAPSEAEKGGE